MIYSLTTELIHATFVYDNFPLSCVIDVPRKLALMCTMLHVLRMLLWQSVQGYLVISLSKIATLIYCILLG